MKRLAAVLAPVALGLLLLAVWEAACRALAIPSYFLPPPSAVAMALAADAPSLAVSAWNTLKTALLALAVASLIAWALALCVALNRALDRAVRPLAVALQVTPVIAIAPLVNVWAGVEHPERAVLTMAVVVAFFPIFSGASTGLKAADPDLERLFDLYQANPLQRLLRLKVPSAAPFVMEGLKVAAGLAVIGAVVAEFAGGSGGVKGLAWRIMEAGNRLQTARMIAALVVLAVMAALLHAALEAAERALIRWWRGR